METAGFPPRRDVTKGVTLTGHLPFNPPTDTRTLQVPSGPINNKRGVLFQGSQGRGQKAVELKSGAQANPAIYTTEKH